MALYFALPLSSSTAASFPQLVHSIYTMVSAPFCVFPLQIHQVTLPHFSSLPHISAGTILILLHFLRSRYCRQPSGYSTKQAAPRQDVYLSSKQLCAHSQTAWMSG